ncbi:MAG: redoxin domain-containing protein [Bacteroidales bacterium]|nr:redoxin domain-containing protein [Bacteroidales bacterium]
MKKYTLYIITALAVSLFVSSCDNSRKGTIEGNITEAEGHLLVLEHLTDGTPRRVDTLRLDASGKFKFTPEVETGLDFFSLHLDNGQSVPVVIDTLLSPVKVTAKLNDLANGYEVADEQNQELKAAALCGNRMRRQVLNLAQAVNNGSLAPSVGRDSLASIIGNYKNEVLTNFIYKNPASAASYYILHESLNGSMIFSPSDNKDNRAFGAVATSWMNTYPNSPRTKVLEQKALDGQRLRHALKQQEAERDSILLSKVSESAFPNLVLRNADDHEVELTSVVDGKNVVVIDFTAYILDSSPAHNLLLGSIYEKYKSKGLEIYQVCMDFDENFWKISADNLPWITVRDENVVYDQYGNIQYAPSALLYNVQSLPTSFIIGKDGEIKARVDAESQLEAELQKLLK